jgi:quinol monooxygenase YgiN
MIEVLVQMCLASPQAAQEICSMNRHAFAWYQEPDWLHGRGVVSTSDPQRVVIVEEWASQPAFDAWFNSPARVKYEQQTALLRVGPVQVEVYEEL